MTAQANPYAAYIGNEEPDKIIARTPQKLSEVVTQLDGEKLNRSYAPGKWNARQIVCHLADCELAFAFRLRQALAEPNHLIQPFNQELWAKPYSNEAFDARTALQVFSTVRHWNLILLKTTPQEARSKPVTHPERGQMTFQMLVEIMAGHDGNHLRQLQLIADAPAA